MPQKKNICFLFTKKYPFGNSETYVEYEIDYLSENFKKVFIIPIEEFNYTYQRDIKHDNVFVFAINNRVSKRGLIKKLTWLLYNQILLLKVFFDSREKIKTLKTWRLYGKRLIHMRGQAEAITVFIRNFSSEKRLIFYHYWLHNSVVIQFLSKLKPDLTISRAHALDLYHKEWPKRDKFSFLQFEKIKIDTCNKIYCISNHGLNHLKLHFKSYSDKFLLSRLGVFDKLSNTNSETLPSRHLIVTCSSLVERKRLLLMPSILKHLKSDYKWIHIGGQKGDEFEQINKLCKLNNVHFEFLGQKTSDEIFSFYSNNTISLFCNLSYAEGIPVSLMEASMFGIPMLATNTFGNPEIVNNENGILIPVEFEPEDVAYKIDDLFRDTSVWRLKSQNSRKTFLDKYNADKNLRDFLSSIFQNLS